MFKVNNKDTRTTSLTIEQIPHLTLMFLLLTLNRKFNCPLEFMSEFIKKKKKNLSGCCCYKLEILHLLLCYYIVIMLLVVR